MCLDVDAPQDLAASNIQTENTMLTWKPPRADITGYILSFESAGGTIRVSVLQNFIDELRLYSKHQQYETDASLLSGGGLESHRRVVQHGSAHRLHRVHGQAAGPCWAQEKPSHQHHLHHQ